jgi:hypothetical protein
LEAILGNRLGKIKKLDLRDIFKDEARDLTPWLAKEENLAVLSEEIGVEIKLVQVEASVGRFNVDILAEEDATGKKIIIENQLEMTDHDHLGKIITYASGHDASIIIWIFRDIRDEHRQAIEWLNEQTVENIDFFAIKLELWQIDESRPAPKFEVIASPNEWVKTIRSNASGAMTDTKLQPLEFWTKFKAWVASIGNKTRLQTPRPQHWYDVSMGSSDAHIALTVNTREGQLGCGLYINSDKELFNFLQGRKADIEKALRSELKWIDAAKASRIFMTKSDFDLQEHSKYDEYFKWLNEMMLKYKEVFSPLITEFKN